MRGFARLSSVVMSARFEGLLHLSGRNFTARLQKVGVRKSRGKGLGFFGFGA